MKRVLLSASMILTLTGCGPASVEDLMEDPEKLAEIAQACAMKMSQGKDTNTEECNNAIEAQKQMAGNMMQGLMKQFAK